MNGFRVKGSDMRSVLGRRDIVDSHQPSLLYFSLLSDMKNGSFHQMNGFKMGRCRSNGVISDKSEVSDGKKEATRNQTKQSQRDAAVKRHRVTDRPNWMLCLSPGSWSDQQPRRVLVPIKNALASLMCPRIS